MDTLITTKKDTKPEGLGTSEQERFISSIQKAHDSNIEDKYEHIIQITPVTSQPEVKIICYYNCASDGSQKVQKHESCPYKSSSSKDSQSPRLKLKKTRYIVPKMTTRQ